MATFTITKEQGSTVIDVFRKYIDDMISKAADATKSWLGSILYVDPTVTLNDLLNTKVAYLEENLDVAVNNPDDNFAALARWLGEARGVENVITNSAGYVYHPEWGNLDSVLKKPLLRLSEPGISLGTAASDAASDIYNVADKAAREVTGAAFDVVEKTANWSGDVIGKFLGGIVSGLGPGGIFLITAAAVIVVGAVLIKKA